MTANIFGSRFLGAREPAWHSLGTVFTDSPTLLEAIGRCNMGYRLVKAPAFVLVDGNYLPIPNRVGIVRYPTEDDDQFRVFGVVGAEYGLMQNDQLARLIDPLTQQWPVETVGALGNGETIFYTLKVSTHRVGGEEVIVYYFVTDTRDGKTTARIGITPQRIVCQNTLSAGIRSAIAMVKIPHCADIADEVQFRVALSRRLQSSTRDLISNFNRMAAATFSANKARAIFEASYPYPNVPAKVALARDLTRAERNELADYEVNVDELTAVEETFEYYVARADAMREHAYGLFQKINDEYPRIARTGWATYNAVCELEDYRKGGDGALASSLFGSRANTKARAYAAVMAALPAQE
jgi:phage/plasmid-like protein (TIGR03299 family)